MTALDLEFVRRQFPAFSEPSLEGWAFFENAGGSYACRQVIDRLTTFYRETKVQPYAPYPASMRGGGEMDAAYARLSAHLNVAPDELVFGPSTTANTYVLSHAFRAGWEAGDEIIVTDQDHEANIGAWRRLAETGVIVREWSADPATGELNPEDLSALMTERTRLVAVTHCSNIVAAPNPIREIADIVHAAGAMLVVDGVSSAPHGLPDVDRLNADIYLFSLYKTWGPHLGAMVVRKRVVDRLANQSHYFNGEDPRKRLAPAGPDHAQIAAAGGVADYLDTLYAYHFPDDAGAAPDARSRRLRDRMRLDEATKLAPLLEYLTHRQATRQDLRVIGPTDATRRAPTIALDTARDPNAVAAALSDHRIMAGAGDFYAPRILKRCGVDPVRGVLRLSFLHYTAPEEIDAAIAALDHVLSEDTRSTTG